MDLGLRGKRALVTAASRGLGFASAAALADEGVQVALSSSSSKSIESARMRIGGDALGFVADIVDPEACRRLVEEVEAALGGIDILVINGPGPPAGTFETVDPDSYLRHLGEVVTPFVQLTSAAVPAMAEAGWGRVIGITSVSAREPLDSMIHSNLSRPGITGFLKSLSREVADRGVTVNTVQPGFHATERLQQVQASGGASGLASVPAGQMGNPEDFGAVVAFLASDQAQYVTGVALPIDGGLSRGLL